MTIYKSFTEELLDEQIKDLRGLIVMNSWIKLKPKLEEILNLEENEILKGVAVDNTGILFYLGTK